MNGFHIKEDDLTCLVFPHVQLAGGLGFGVDLLEEHVAQGRGQLQEEERQRQDQVDHIVRPQKLPQICHDRLVPHLDFVDRVPDEEFYRF